MPDITDTAFEWAVFVSYSRRNRKIVAPIVEIVRAVGVSAFRDEQSIPPGKQWKTTIARSLAECRVVLVFWSAAASKSEAVAEEYRTAISLGKDVVPLLIDSTPLPTALAAYQWIDLRPALKPVVELPLPEGFSGPLGSEMGDPAAVVNSLYRALPRFLRAKVLAAIPLKVTVEGIVFLAPQLRVRLVRSFTGSPSS